MPWDPLLLSGSYIFLYLFIYGLFCFKHLLGNCYISGSMVGTFFSVFFDIVLVIWLPFLRNYNDSHFQLQQIIEINQGHSYLTVVISFISLIMLCNIAKKVYLLSSSQT